jgi:hypothetical protein
MRTPCVINSFARKDGCQNSAAMPEIQLSRSYATLLQIYSWIYAELSTLC